MDLSRGFLELQSALEGSDSKFVNLFVKGLGFLVQLGFERNRGSWQVGLHENHPFVMVPLMDPVQGDGQSNNILRKIVAKAKLVRMGSISSTELGKHKAYLLNAKPHGLLLLKL